MTLRNWIAICAVGVVLVGCGPTQMTSPGASVGAPDVSPGEAPGTVAGAPKSNATTAEQYDTTSAAERVAASRSSPQTGEIRLGTTVASLGNPADPGFWAETGMVDKVTQGRLEYPQAGTSVKVELRPSGGAPSSGTRVSLPALRVLEAPLTALPQLVVYEG